MVGEIQPKILLLEDHALVRGGIRVLIHEVEPRAVIVEAGSWEEALARLAAAPIDIAFVDIDLKGSRSGIDVLRFIRDSQLPTRVVMLSAQAEESVVLTCIRLGACGYIPKDMECDGLFRLALDTVMQGAIFLPAGLLGRSGSSQSGLSTAPASLDEIGVRGRALEVLYYICQGESNKAIAAKMKVTERTVANDYNTKLFKQFRVINRTQLVVEIARRGIIPPRPEDHRVE